MSQGQRHFTDEFEPEAVALLVGSGQPLSRIASELGISPLMLRNCNGSGGRDAVSDQLTRPAKRAQPRASKIVAFRLWSRRIGWRA
jgi:hypothetical protein